MPGAVVKGLIREEVCRLMAQGGGCVRSYRIYVTYTYGQTLQTVVYTSVVCGASRCLTCHARNAAIRNIPSVCCTDFYWKFLPV